MGISGNIIPYAVCALYTVRAQLYRMPWSSYSTGVGLWNCGASIVQGRPPASYS